MARKQNKHSKSKGKTNLQSSDKATKHTECKMLDNLIGIIKEGENMNAVEDKYELYNR